MQCTHLPSHAILFSCILFHNNTELWSSSLCKLSFLFLPLFMSKYPPQHSLLKDTWPREVSGSLVCDHEDCCLLRCKVVQSSRRLPKFRRNALRPSSGQGKEEVSFFSDRLEWSTRLLGVTSQNTVIFKLTLPLGWKTKFLSRVWGNFMPLSVDRLHSDHW